MKPFRPFHPGSSKARAHDADEDTERRDSYDGRPSIDRPSLEPFDAREPGPLSARVALPWVVFNALVVAGVLWARPTQHADAPSTSIAETTVAPVTEGRVSAEHGHAPLREPDRASPTSLSQSELEDAATKPLTIYPVLSVEDRLYVLEGTDTEKAAGKPRGAHTVALPGGGILETSARAESTLSSGTWTVLSRSGACTAELGQSVRLSFDPGEPGAELPAPLAAHELRGCRVQHDTTDQAVAIQGSHPDARYEPIGAGDVHLTSGVHAFDTSDADSCDGRVRVTSSSGALLREEPGAELAGRIQVEDRELLVLRGEAGVRVLDVRGDSVALAAREPFSPLWLGALDPQGC